MAVLLLYYILLLLYALPEMAAAADAAAAAAIIAMRDAAREMSDGRRGFVGLSTALRLYNCDVYRTSTHTRVKSPMYTCLMILYYYGVDDPIVGT